MLSILLFVLTLTASVPAPTPTATTPTAASNYPTKSGWDLKNNN